VELLIQNGADVNVEGGVFFPPRWRAWIANLEVRGGDYGTAIQAASYYGCLEIVKLLLNNGADVHAQGRPFPLAMIQPLLNAIQRRQVWDSAASGFGWWPSGSRAAPS
jgi:hypothetical protein